MSSRVLERPDNVNAASSWPYERMPEVMTQKRRSTGWVLAISVEPELHGLVTYYPAGSGKQVLHINNGTTWGKKITTRPFYRVRTKEEAEKFCISFCSRGYSANERLLPHQDGEFWSFNWSSLTAATVAVASQIAEHYFNGRVDAAWDTGRAFEKVLNEAENAYHDAKRKAASVK